MKLTTSLAALVFATLAIPAAAQPPDLTVSYPSTLVIPNYHRVLIGQREGIECGAYVARSARAASVWYNPAGLAQAEKTGLDASANAYELTSATVEGLGESVGRSKFGTVSTIVAAVIAEPLIHSDSWRLGGAYTSPVSWQPPAIDAATHDDLGGVDRDISFYMQSAFTQQIPAVGAGFKLSPTLRLGAGVGVAITQIELSQSVDNIQTSATELRALTRQVNADGTTTHAQFTGGMQWELSPAWSFGAVVTSPGMRLGGSALLKYQASTGQPNGFGWLSFRDEKAKLEYKIPLYASAGLAWTGSRASIEADVRYHGSAARYSVLSSTAAGTVSIDTVGSSGPIEGAVAFQDAVNEAREVICFAVGGNYDLGKGWQVHLGYASDPSPVADAEESLFRKDDLTVLSGGLSIEWDHVAGSLGVGYTSGKSTPINADLGLGTTGTSQLHVSTLNLSYALAFKF